MKKSVNRTVKMKKQGFAIVLLFIAATGALAHQGVKNPAVKARMDSMSAIGKSMKVLGGMAKGESSFDAMAVQAAVASIAEQAARTPALFEANETDPKSESNESSGNTC